MEEKGNIQISTLAELPFWSKSYRNQIGLESMRKKLKNLDSLMDSDKVNKYRSSEEHRTAIKLFGECDTEEFILTARRFTLMRNYLIFNLNLKNANRAGVLAELTMSDYLKREKYHDRDTGTTRFMITIIEHKTLATAGPAKISLNGTLNSEMDLYAEYVRRKVVIEECDSFFTTFKGTPLHSSSAIAQSLSSHTTGAGIGHITSNDCRRSAATITRAINPQMAATMAIHMNHSEAIADKVYNISNKDESSFRAVQFLDSVYEENLKKQFCLIKEESPGVTES